MDNPDHISESLETIFLVKILKVFDADQGAEMVKIQIRYGKKTRIRDKHPRSATLIYPDRKALDADLNPDQDNTDLLDPDPDPKYCKNIRYLLVRSDEPISERYLLTLLVQFLLVMLLTYTQGTL